MTRVTAFGFPKKGNVGSTWEELTGGGDNNNAESSEMASQRTKDNKAPGDNKRKRRDEEGDPRSGSGERTGGWGKNDDIKR
jgi:hypothetical protein